MGAEAKEEAFKTNDSVEVYCWFRKQWLASVIVEILPHGSVHVDCGAFRKVVPRLQCTSDTIRKKKAEASSIATGVSHLTPARCCRALYCKEINFFEEFYNLVGGDHESFDDEHEHVEITMSNTCRCRHFYGKEIFSYEEFFYLVGGDHEMFDDEQELLK